MVRRTMKRPSHMPKLKTNKSVRARFKVTKSGILLRRRVGQNHFRGLKSGKVRRRLRKYARVSKAEAKTLKRYLPYR